MSKIAVFGGLGFIGQNLCKDLLQDNEVIIFDNHSNPSRLSGELDYYASDARIKREVDDFFEQHQFDAVINLVANADIQVSTTDRFIDFELSPITNLNILAACEKNNVPKYVYFSGSGVYGPSEDLTPKYESDASLNCPSMYACSKISCESFATAFANSSDMSVAILRPANIIGPGLTHGLIYDVLLRIRNNREQIHILGNGTQQKSYIHTDDVISGVRFMLDTNEKVSIFNIASDDTITVKEIVDEIIEQTGFGTKVNYGEKNIGWVGDVPKIQLNCDKLKSIGWSPKYNSKQAVYESVKANLDLLN